MTIATATATLTSNGRPIPFDTDHFGELRSSEDIADDPLALRARFHAEGYVLLRGLLDREAVLDLRAAYFASFASYDGDHAHGVAGHPAHAFVRTARFQAFSQQRALLDVARTLLGARPLALPRKILRDYRRETQRASRVHADFPYIDRGTDEVLTAWIPIGDCPVESGPLVYLEGSHRIARDALPRLREVTDRPDDRRALSHDLAWVAEQLDRRWLATDVRAGDVILHSPHIIHASLDNASPAPRLSTDVRFIPADHQADPRWSRAWSGDDGY